MLVCVQYLKVNLSEREWWLDLPELTSIRLGTHSFRFSDDNESTELIMQSGYDEMNWRIDLPKLKSLTTTGNSAVFWYPRSVTLEGMSYHSLLTNRHALSHYCFSWKEIRFQKQENRSYKEYLLLLSLIPRHHSCSPTVPPVHCFLHTPFSSQHQIAVFTSHNNYSFPSSLSLFLFLPIYRMSCYHAFFYANSLIS